MDKEKAKEIMDDFENDDFVSAKEKFKSAFKDKVEKYIKDETGIEGDIFDKEEDDPDNDDNLDSDDDDE